MTRSSEFAALRPVADRHAHAGEWLEWAALVAIPSCAWTLRTKLQPWEFMWALAAAIFLGCKLQTWFHAREARSMASTRRSLGYLFLWPGMDAPRFLVGKRPGPQPSPRNCAAAAGKTIAGAWLVIVIARRAPVTNGLLGGWIGMVGIVLMLHFGLFDMIAMAWQYVGIDARPIMRSPGLATSLSEFWGRRWNTGFRQLSHRLAYEPVRTRAGRAAATLAAFFASGIVHDVVISVPAGAGYGLPTAYFLLQGIGVLFQRSSAGSWLGIQSGVRGWLFTLLCAGAPAYWLFHPAFVHNVMLPFFAAVGKLAR